MFWVQVPHLTDHGSVWLHPEAVKQTNKWNEITELP